MNKLFLLIVLVASLPGGALADSLSPCQSGTLTSIANTSCTIGDLLFSFGTPDATPAPVTFTPDLTNAGFVLTGPVTFTNTSLLDRLLGDVNLPFVAQSLNGQPLILGFISSVSGSPFNPVNEGGLCNTNVAQFQCALNGLNGEFAAPLSAASGQFHAFIIGPEHALLSDTFTSGSFQVLETPEPSSLLLVAAGILGFAKRAHKFLLRP
jgi:hypothetical protein